ncbi:MAG: histidinol-phosphatase HisJ family protein [Oscillospiraceae bacterium]|jgi:histidinol-phosphatase (PHP family)|nr:histidinol-phosphatase HisJ family protein [Oscillospiraceae bacterium]
MKIYDTHIHSKNSLDAKSTVDEICQSAILKGVCGITITDHIESYGVGSDAYEFGNSDVLIPQSFKEIAAAQAKYVNKLQIFKGIEFGQPCLSKQTANHVASYGETDFVLASVHADINGNEYYYIDFSKTDYSQVLEGYFAQVLTTAQNAEFDSLAHLTYPLRYIFRDTGVRVDALKSNGVAIARILHTLAIRGKALEVNTSELFRDYGTFLPDEEIVRLFYRLGGKYVTLGSDSHVFGTIGQGFEAAAACLQKAGFGSYVYYANHNPVSVAL